MKKLLLILTFLAISISFYGQNSKYKISDDKSVYFEEILNFKGTSKLELHNRILKALRISNYTLIYEDDNEIYAVGKFEVQIRKHALVFFKTDEKNCLYDLKINIKEGKIRFRGTNFYLIPQSIKINSFGLNSNNSSGINGSWSTTKIPLDIPKISVDNYYRKNLNKDKNLLFNDIEENISDFQDTLKNILNEDEDDW